MRHNNVSLLPNHHPKPSVARRVESAPACPRCSMASSPLLMCWKDSHVAAVPLTLRVSWQTRGLWEQKVTRSFHKSSNNPVTLDDSRSHLVIYFISFCHIWLFTLLARAHTRLLFNDRCCPFSTTQLHTRLPPSEVHTLHAQMRKQLMDESTSKGSAPRTEKDTRIQIALCHTHGNRSAASSGLAPSPPLQSWDSPMVNNA